MKKLLLTFCLLAALVLPAPCQSNGVQTFNFSAGIPSPVVGASYTISGTPGRTIYYYWVVARYPAGYVAPAGPVAVTNAPDALSGSNYVVINWAAPASQATSYDVLRTTTPNFPGSCTCQVGTNTSSFTISDQGSALNSYTFTGAVNANGAFQLNNRDYTYPVLFLLDGNANQVFAFPLNGSTYTDATGADPGGVYSAEITATLAQINSGLTFIPANSGRTLKVVGIFFKVSGAFATCTDVRVSDTAGPPVDVVTVAVAGLTNGAIIGEATTANVTLGTFAASLTAAQGLKVRQTGSACTGGTNILIRVLYKINS